MQLLLIRHALPVRRENIDGPADPELTDIGHAQAQHLADYLEHEPLTAIYCSTMMRARQTAAPLLTIKGMSATFDDRLAEFDLTSASYVPAEELKAANDGRWQQLLSGPKRPEDVARTERFRDRVRRGMADIVTSNEGGTVAVVCHAGVIGSYLADVLNITLVGPSFFAANYTSISRVMASRKGTRTIYTMNETSHLRGTGLPTGLYD
jgi:2,3-bisphosphoglycerate-dependent phosphoglycerate mutase